MGKVRVRFAPSPTGGLHIGGLRTALFNYLFAKKNNGTFILRIEDTDQARFVEGAEQYIREALNWSGIRQDEGPEAGGDFGPYRQSERRDIYHKYAQQLLDEDKAYYAFDTPEELDQMRERLKEAGMANLTYNSASRMYMKNSITMDAPTVQKMMDGGVPYVIRLKVPAKEDIRFEDKIRGWVHVHSSTIDDKVIIKSDGLPTYHLANVVDDHLMEISHVVRGEEWLPSAPLHVLLYRFLGWGDQMPTFAHLPLILKPDGNGKLSKRAADKAGFPIFPLTWTDPASNETNIGFRETGYLPEALINFLALLGWNPGSDQEIFSLEELSKAFSLERIGKAGTKFDIEKARWFNQQYINMAPDEQLARMLQNDLKKELGIVSETAHIQKIAGLLKTRVTFMHEMTEAAKLFFQFPDQYDEKVIRKRWNEETEKGLTAFSNAIESEQAIAEEQARSLYHQTLEAEGINPGRVMQMLRVSITGQASGPDLMKIIEILGGEEVSKRIFHAIDMFKEVHS